MKHYYCPSLMCADFSKLKDEILELNNSGIDMYHMDVMDGNFVPNFGLGPEDFKAVSKLASKPMDAHLMVSNPSRYLELFKSLGAKLIYIHYESEYNPTRSLMRLKELGLKAGLAINPDTSFEMVESVLPYVDDVLVMTVNPGFAGQKYLSTVETKVKKLAENKDKYDYRIMIDGALSPKHISTLKSIGADGFILGTSTLFGKEKSYSEIMKDLS